MKLSRLLSLAASVALVAAAANAQIVYDNGTYATNSNSHDISNFGIADDFTVASSLTFDSIRFWATDNVPGLAGNFSGTLSWFVHTNNAGRPSSTIVASGTTSNVGRIDTGDILLGFPNLEIGQWDFSTGSVTLGAGTYWLRLKEGTASSAFDGSPIYWMQTQGAPISNAFRVDPNEVNPSSWNLNNVNFHLAYQLRSNAAAAPEPTSLALSVGLLATGIIKRRRSA